MIEEHSYEWFIQKLEEQIAEITAVREDIFLPPSERHI